MRKIFNGCVNNIARDWHEETCRDLLNYILRDNEGTLFFWSVEDGIETCIEDVKESLAVHQQLLDGLIEFHKEMKKEFDK